MQNLLFIFLLLGGYCAFGQEIKSGTAVYEQTVKLEIKLEGEAAGFAANLPKERKSEKVLYFNDKQSLFENQKSSGQEEIAMQSGGGNMMIKMAEPDNKTFTDLTEKKQLEMREFMTRIFLIDSNLELNWKITGNQKMIKDYPCMEATCTDGERKVVAWFTPAIPIPAGPGKYAGLPGLVLSLEIDEGKSITTLKSIDFNPVGKEVFVRPDKGKKVTKAEFDQIVAEKVKEMGGQSTGSGSGTTFMIRIQK